MFELIVLLVCVVVILLVLYFKGKHIDLTINEAFENYYLASCPSGYKSFYNNEGNMICCDGEIMGNRCLGDRQCVLNGAGTTDTPNCVTSILEEYTEKAQLQCPKSMMFYFEDKTQNTKGCTSGPLNSTLNRPKLSNQPTCFIYKNSEQNVNSKNSCYNQQLLDNTPCFGNNCTKELVQPVEDGPVLIGIGFTDTSGIHRTTYTRQSLENYLNVSNPNWRNQGLDLSKNISVAEIAKAYFVDKTMSSSDVQL